ncbi:MAG: hemerythrin domain-containing protein [Bacteroidetes bacterium]|nr:hemerythrin domain-containing protein [Bacteroidota bacterium]
MNRPLHAFFTADHRRLEAILDAAFADPKAIDHRLYDQFRAGLLRHIGMEEKILFVAAQQANGGEPLPIQAKLRLDHGALTSLMVIPPGEALTQVIRHVLDLHDELEEKPGGMYDACEHLTKHQTEDLLARLAQVPETPVHPPNPSPKAIGAARRAMARAGFNYDALGGPQEP